MPTAHAKPATGQGPLDAALLVMSLIVLHAGVDASGGAADATVPGVKAGYVLKSAINLTDLTDATADFAPVANGDDTISQLTTDLSAKKILFFVIPNVQ